MQELRRERRRAQAREKRIKAALKTLDEAIKARPQLSRSYKNKLRNDVRGADKPTIAARNIIKDLPAPNTARVDTNTTGIIDLSPSEECRATLARKVSGHLCGVAVYDEEIRQIEGKHLKGMIAKRQYMAALAKLAKKDPPEWMVDYQPEDFRDWNHRPLKSAHLRQSSVLEDGSTHEQIENIPSFFDRRQQNSRVAAE